MLFALAAGFAPGALAQAKLAPPKPDWQVKQRQAAMTLQGKYTSSIGAMLKGAVPYNAEVVAREAWYLEALSQMPWDGFSADTQGEKSRAKPEIYKDAARFKAAYERFQAEAGRLSAAAKAKDQPGVRAAFGAVTKVCGECHEDFRQR